MSLNFALKWFALMNLITLAREDKMTMTLQQVLTAYCRTIRNEAKRAYAEAYVAHLANGSGAAPEYRCGTMAAQAVRMNVNEILWRSGKSASALAKLATTR